MRKYCVQNGKVIINRYCVEYKYSSQGGNIETNFDVTQYIADDLELNGLISELQRKGIEYKITEFDVSDIQMYNGMPVESDEEDCYDCSCWYCSYS